MKKEGGEKKSSTPVPRKLGTSRPQDRVTKWRTSVEKKFRSRLEKGNLSFEFQLNGKLFRMLKFPFKRNTYRIEKLNDEVFS